MRFSVSKTRSIHLGECLRGRSRSHPITGSSPRNRSKLLYRAALFLGIQLALLDPASAERPLLLASVPPQAFFLERIVGDYARVESMIPPSANHGVYEPTIEQMKQLAVARVYFKVGHPAFSFEDEWLKRIAGQNAQLTVVDCSAGMPLLPDDPHIWVAPKSVRLMGRKMADALEQSFPAERTRFENNWQQFEREIDSLDSQFKTLFADVRGRSFIVFHSEWGYFARDYGVVQIAIEREGKEPDGAQLAGIIKQGKEKGIRVVFVQPQFSETSAGVVAQAIGATVRTLDPFGRNWTDNIQVSAREIHRALTE